MARLCIDCDASTIVRGKCPSTHCRGSDSRSRTLAEMEPLKFYCGRRHRAVARDASLYCGGSRRGRIPDERLAGSGSAAFRGVQAPACVPGRGRLSGCRRFLVQLASSTFGPLGFPEWSQRALIIVVAVGFLPACALAWIFDLTSAGVVRTAALPSASQAPVRFGRNTRILAAEHRTDRLAGTG